MASSLLTDLFFHHGPLGDPLSDPHGHVHDISGSYSTYEYDTTGPDRWSGVDDYSHSSDHGHGLKHGHIEEEECCPLVIDFLNLAVVLFSIAGATLLLWNVMNNCCFRDPTSCADSTRCPAIVGRRRKRSVSKSFTLQGKKINLILLI